MAVFACPHCDEEFKADGPGSYKCPHCGHEIVLEFGIVSGVPWEARGRLNIFRAFFETWKNVIVSPVKFFKSVRPKDAMMLALYFGIICQSVNFIVTWLYEAGFNFLPGIYSWFSSFAGWGMMDFSGLLEWPRLPYYLIIIISVSPFLSVIALFFMSLVYHVCLMILGSAKNGFGATLKAVSYGASAQVFSLVPVVGSLVAAIWSLILTIIGLKELHRSTYGRVIIGVLLPVFFCCGFILLLAALFIGLFMEGFAGAGNFSV